MEIFIISFMIYILVALAIGIGILIRGKAMSAGCGGTEELKCKYKSICGNKCRSLKNE
jgi:hypothetical protein